jgi:heptosyltransferase-2/heptosyltransferase-3
MLQISDPGERALVRAADAALGIVSSLARPFRSRSQPHTPQRILLLRLERIGDLLMTLPAIRDIRTLAPSSEIDLVVGSWNATLAKAVPYVNRVLTLDARWLAREGGGLAVPALLRAAREWRDRQYDLAINFEPDVRSNLLLGASGAAWTAGWAGGGGGPVLDVALDYDTGTHTSTNARRLVETVFGRVPDTSARPALTIPETAVRAATAWLPVAAAGPLVGIHTSGGRAIKQWDPERFATVAARLVDERSAAIVLTGGAADADLVNRVKAAMAPRPVIDATGEVDLLVLAALLQRLDLFVTGDTGPMHLAAAVGTPVVAVFGPSAPARYAPRGALDRIVRVELPCSPCNRIRRPPARCQGHTPDCLAGVSADAVFVAAISVLEHLTAPAARGPRDRA